MKIRKNNFGRKQILFKLNIGKKKWVEVNIFQVLALLVPGFHLMMMQEKVITQFGSPKVIF